MGQLPQIETLQDLTAAAASYSHYAHIQKLINALNKEANKMHITDQETEISHLISRVQMYSTEL